MLSVVRRVPVWAVFGGLALLVGVSLLADGALWLLWAAPGFPSSTRLRRVPLRPASTAVELSERREGGKTVRHWAFELDREALVFRTTGDDEPERLARALAGALGWPQ